MARPGLGGNPKRFSSSSLHSPEGPARAAGPEREVDQQKRDFDSAKARPRPRKTVVIESPGPRRAQRAIHVLYASPDQKARKTTAAQASISPVARALLYSAPADQQENPGEGNSRKRKLDRVGSSGFTQAISDCESLLTTRQHDPLRAAQRSGKQLRTMSFIMDELRHAANAALRVLPEECVIAMMHETKTSYDELDPAEVLSWFHGEAIDGHWKAADLSAFRVALAYVLNWLDEKDLMPEDGDLSQIPTWRVATCLREFRDAKRVQLAEKNAAVQSAKAVSGEADAMDQPKARKPWTGTHAGQFYLKGLKFGRKYLKLPIRTEDITLSSSWDGGRQEPPQPAASTTMYMVLALEALLLRSGTNIVHRHLAAAYLFLCYACMRCAQAQDCWITGIVGEKFIEGYVTCEKNPNRKKRFPRPFWASLFGITGSRLWFDALIETLADVAENCYIFRAFFSDDGSVLSATSLAPGPLRCGPQLTGVMREILQLACGWTVQQSLVYTEHSPRHFLAEASRGRNEPGTCRHELGRWSRSVAQLPEMRPVSGTTRKHAHTLSIMPDRYSQDAAKLRPMTIIQRQMEAMIKLVTSFGETLEERLQKFPKYGGWNLLDQFVKTDGGQFEE